MGFASTKSGMERSREHPADDGMLYVPGGTFRMGSDRHYPEEAPVHSVTVDGFWMDRTPVTNRQFRKFINATGYVTFAELTPNPKDYPDALPHMLKAGSLVFTPPRHAVDLRDLSQWWSIQIRRQLAPALWAAQQYQRARRSSGGPRRLSGRRSLCQMGRQGIADRGRMGICRARRT